MPKIPHTVIRGRTYYLRLRIPNDVLPFYEGRKEIQKTLGTSSAKEARRKITVAKLEVESEFDAKRNTHNIRYHRRGVETLTSTEIASMILGWFREQDEANELEDAKFAIHTKSSANEVLADVRDSYTEACDELSNKTRTASIAEEFLIQRNLQPDPDNANFKTIEDRLARARVELSKRRLQRLEGDPLTGTGDQYFSYSPLKSERASEISFGKLCERYVQSRIVEHGLRQKSVDGLKAEIAVLQKFIPQAERLSNITRARCREIFEAVQKMPANMSKLYPTMAIDEAISAARTDGSPLLSPPRVNAYMSRLSSIFKFGMNEEYTTSNPANNLQVKDKVDPRDKKHPFSSEHIQKIFNADYATVEDHPDRSGKYWVPIISLWSGLRLEEICKLTVSDIRPFPSCSVFEVKGLIKTVKSRRLVPIHPVLVKLGFMDLVKARQKAGINDLFPELPIDKYGKRSHEFSKYFGRKLDRLGIKDKKLTFHSFRHAFTNALKAQNVPASIIQELGGWKGQGMDNLYGSPSEIETLFKHLKKIIYEGFEHKNLL